MKCWIEVNLSSPRRLNQSIIVSPRTSPFVKQNILLRIHKNWMTCLVGIMHKRDEIPLFSQSVAP